jgi:hypothetical protein
MRHLRCAVDAPKLLSVAGLEPAEDDSDGGVCHRDRQP